MKIQGVWLEDFQKLVENAERLKLLWNWLMSDFYIAPELPEELQKGEPDPLLDPLLAGMLDENLQTIELLYSVPGWTWADGTEAPAGTLCGVCYEGNILIMEDFNNPWEDNNEIY